MSDTQLPSIGVIEFSGYTLDVDRYLRSEYPDIGEAAVELPAAIEWLNTVLYYYVSTELMESRAIKAAEAEAYFNLRNGGFAEKYGDKMTEKALEHAINLDPGVQTAVNSHADAKAWVVRLRNLIDTLIAKLDIVRTVEATRRRVDTSLSPH